MHLRRHSLKSRAWKHKTVSALKACRHSRFPYWTWLRSQIEIIYKVSDYAPFQTKNPRTEASRNRRRVNFIRGEATSPNNPKKGRSGRHKTSDSECLLDVSTEDNKCNRCMASNVPYNMFIK